MFCHDLPHVRRTRALPGRARHDLVHDGDADLARGVVGAAALTGGTSAPHLAAAEITDPAVRRRIARRPRSPAWTSSPACTAS
ncbi:hypothetical protein [Actinomadura rifamycini]|uniref:hypothetical protein n=1 Tax=Actinomadura rifamycini TaxID=31962 RepID=UPI0003F7F4C4|nr:hypothetical protein [Actinomadura rifamycini]